MDSSVGDQDKWSDIWRFSIMLSAVSLLAAHERDRDTLRDLVEEFGSRAYRLGEFSTLFNALERLRDCAGDDNAPVYIKNQLMTSSIVNEIVIAGPGYIEDHINKAIPALMRYATAIRTPIAYFVDRTDQQVDRFPPEIWHAAQCGLVMAAFHLARDTQRLKTYYSVRQESFDAFQHNLRGQVLSTVVCLEYEEPDMKEMFTRGVVAYQDECTLADPGLASVDPIGAFVGTNEIINDYSKEPEKTFEYMIRHTLGRPRDLVLIGAALSQCDPMLRRDRFGFIVNTVPAKELIGTYLDTVLRFVPRISKELLIGVLARAKTNVLRIEDLKRICRELSKKHECKTHCKDCQDGVHVFCELYDIGLVGVIERAGLKDEDHQAFVCAHNIPMRLAQAYVQGGNTHLPDSSYYLLHPCTYEVPGLSGANKIAPVIGITIGHGKPWSKRHAAIMLLMDVRRILNEAKATVKEVPELGDVMAMMENVSYQIDRNNVSDNDRSWLKSIGSSLTTTGMAQAAGLVNHLLGAAKLLYEWSQ